MSFTLRSLSDINALINGADYAGLSYSRKYQLAGQVEAASLELDIVIPVLVAQAATPLEDQFVRALVSVSSDSDVTASTAYGPYLVVPMFFEGTLANNQIFGWFVTPAALNILGLQLTLQQPDPDAALTVVLVNEGGVPFSDSNWPLLTPGSSFQYSTLNDPLPLAAGQLVRATTSAYVPGSQGPKGAALTCNLIGRFIVALLCLFLAASHAFAQVSLTLDGNTNIRSSALTATNANTIVDGLNANATHPFALGLLPSSVLQTTGNFTLAGTITFTVAPIFTDVPGTRAALSLGSAATHAATDFDPAGAAAAATPANLVGATLYVDAVNGNDATAARGRRDKPFLTLTAAKTAASAGDEICVGPGVYNEANLAANNVRWHFENGALVTSSSGSSAYIFDDGGAAMTVNVTGSGDFLRSNSAGGVVHLSNAASIFNIQCSSISNDNATTGSETASYAINQTNGALSVRCRLLESTNRAAVYWSNGDLKLDCQTIQTTGNAYCLWAAVTGTPTGKFWCRAIEIKSLSNTAVGQPTLALVGTNAAARVWIDAQQIYSAADQAILAFAGINHVHALKIWGLINDSSAYAGSELYVTAQKQALLTSSTGTAPYAWLVLNGLNAFINIDEYDASVVPTSAIQCSGKATVKGGTIATSGQGIICGGTLRLKNMLIDTSAGTATNPVTKNSASTLILDHSTLRAATGQSSIAATDAETAVSLDTFANTAPSTNVTVQGVFTIGSYVQ